MISRPAFVQLCIIVTSFKLLFFESYLSTDFDVHRNWMSITSKLPIKEWYYNETSKWTLDYPPIFAAFEYLLALISMLFIDKNNLNLINEPIRNQAVRYFQKSSVVASDVVFYYSIYKVCSILNNTLSSTKPVPGQPTKKGLEQNLVETLTKPDKTTKLAILLILQPGLILIDHIHFQYNGFLIGIFLTSIACAIERRYVASTFWFCFLLNLKHLFLYAAPSYGIYFLSSYCILEAKCIKSFIKNFSKLAAVAIIVFVTTYTPFFIVGKLPALIQIASRLFPFKRGLTHIYWAPNFWSLYNSADKFTSLYLRVVKKVDITTKGALLTSGLIEDSHHEQLPEITPLNTFIIVAILNLPVVIILLFKSRGSNSSSLFIKSIVLTCFTSFMFGWHVHEKAIIIITIPLMIASHFDSRLEKTLLRVILAGTYSLFPLLYEPFEYITKVLLIASYFLFAQATFNQSSKQHKNQRPWCKKTGSFIELAYIFGFIALEFINFIIKLSTKYEFLPLILVSNYSAIGIIYSYLEIYYYFAL